MRKAYYAKIHIAKKQQGLDEETYRAFLLDITGKESLKGMNARELQKVVSAFTRTGFVETKKAGKPRVELHLVAYIGKIEALLAELGRVRKMYVTWEYAGTILAQMYNIPTWHMAKREHLQGVIVALINQVEAEDGR